MPWTFSHPAIVFPLKNSLVGRWLSLPGLILGSLSPDLFYSFGLYQIAKTSHNLIGWFYFALPFCWLISFIVYRLSKPLSQVLPLPIEFKSPLNLMDIILFSLSLYIGAVTHILWDSFTHDTGFFVELFPPLTYRLFAGLNEGLGIGIYSFLQYLSSLLGLIYLIIKYRQYQKRQPLTIQQSNQKKLYNLLKIGAISALLSIPWAWSIANETTRFNFNRFVFEELTLTVPFFFSFVILMAVGRGIALSGKKYD